MCDAMLLVYAGRLLSMSKPYFCPEDTWTDQTGICSEKTSLRRKKFVQALHRE